jgi:glycosyltransferase involved in cell wall biosynthesis
MRIGFVCNEYPPGPHGGIGTFTQVMARALTAAGHHVRVIGVYPHDYPAPDYEDDRGVCVWRQRMPKYRFGWIPARYQLFRTIAAWSKNEEVDVVEVPDWEGWAAGWPTICIPVICRLHGSASYFAAELGRRIKRTLFHIERMSLNRADFWCSVSQYTADKTQRLFDLSTPCSAILHNPVEVPTGSDSRVRSKNRVVFTGTLTWKKGIVSLINAWPRVLKECAKAELHVFGKDGRAGDGQSMQTVLRRQLNGQTGVSVFFYGHVPRERLFQELLEARVAVFPSHAESFGLGAAESMARGCPTVFSRWCSGPEVMEHEKHGLLVDPEKPQEIADAIVRLLKDDRLSRQLGAAATDRVQRKFSVDVLLERNLKFYRHCVAKFSCGEVELTTANAV